MTFIKRIASSILVLALTVPAAYAQVQETGTPPSTPALTSTFGTDVPAKAALQQLAPQGWGVYVHKGLTLPSTLSWKAGQSWPAVVAALAKQHTWDATIDWNAQALYLKQGVAPPAPAVVEAVVKASATADASGALRLDIAPGETLRTAMERLAQTQGWALEWNAGRDFKATKGYQVSGTSLRDLLERVLASQGLSASVFYTEKVIRVQPL